jgi:chromosome segregation ATPase
MQNITPLVTLLGANMSPLKLHEHHEHQKTSLLNQYIDGNVSLEDVHRLQMLEQIMLEREILQHDEALIFDAAFPFRLLASECLAFSKKIAKVNDDKDLLMKEKEDLKDANEGLEADLQDCRTYIQDLEEGEVDLHNTTKDLKNTNKDLVNDKNELKKVNEQLIQKIEEVSERNRVLEKALADGKKFFASF